MLLSTCSVIALTSTAGALARAVEDAIAESVGCGAGPIVSVGVVASKRGVALPGAVFPCEGSWLDAKPPCGEFCEVGDCCSRIAASRDASIVGESTAVESEVDEPVPLPAFTEASTPIARAIVRASKLPPSPSAAPLGAGGMNEAEERLGAVGVFGMVVAALWIVSAAKARSLADPAGAAEAAAEGRGDPVVAGTFGMLETSAANKASLAANVPFVAGFCVGWAGSSLA